MTDCATAMARVPGNGRRADEKTEKEVVDSADARQAPPAEQHNHDWLSAQAAAQLVAPTQKGPTVV
ncbi:MAG: hypothetical protein Q8N81_06690 [bacterium]|nr:hypothetical protein [bacterium]